MEESFGSSWSQLIQLDPKPIGSGCMAQVYHGYLAQGPGQPRREVAVKVRHPGAAEKVDLDLEVMHTVAWALEALWPSAKYLAMSEALVHFEDFIRPQADMRIEAANLKEFNHNFAYARTGRGLAVTFPQVFETYVSESVLVETFEHATPLQEVLGKVNGPCDGSASSLGSSLGSSQEVKDEVGKLCMDSFLKMLFADNFIHGDMHPGNIHVRFPKAQSGPELVLLDAGLAVKMTPRDRRNFVELFYAIAENDGCQAGRLMIERSPGDRSLVIDEDGFVRDVGELVGQLRGGGIALGAVRFGDIFGRMLSLACDHRVKLETSFVKVATSMIVLEGVGRQLNPIVDLIVAARPLLVEAMAEKLWLRKPDRSQ